MPILMNISWKNVTHPAPHSFVHLRYCFFFYAVYWSSSLESWVAERKKIQIQIPTIPLVNSGSFGKSLDPAQFSHLWNGTVKGTTWHCACDLFIQEAPFRLELLSVQSGGHSCSYRQSLGRASLGAAKLQVLVSSCRGVSVVQGA